MLLGLLVFVGAAVLVERGLGLDEPIRIAAPTAVVIAAIPALLWLGYFYAQDRHEPEPKHFVFGVYLLGAFIAAPVANFAIHLVLTPRVGAPITLDPLAPQRLVAAFAVIGVAQELTKYAVVRYTLYPSPEFDEPLDGIVYATAAAIGFATYENYQYLQGLRGAVFLSTGAAQTVVTTLAHASFAGILGYALGKAKFSTVSTPARAAILFGGILVAALLNGQYVLVDDMVNNKGMAVHPWRGVAYTFGFASVIFLATSLLMRRLLAVSPHRSRGARE